MRTLVDLLDRGVSGLARLPGAAPGEDAGHGVRVVVGDRKGELARLLAAVAGLGVTAEDATVDALAEAGLTVRFACAADRRPPRGAAHRRGLERRTRAARAPGPCAPRST
ncbi:hypothetical protein SALBM135S_09505 [Streptomyces alboniger]